MTDKYEYMDLHVRGGVWEARMSPEAEAMLMRMYDAGGTWSDRAIANRPFGHELMQKGLVELIEPDAPYLPYACLTKAGERRARELTEPSKSSRRCD